MKRKKRKAYPKCGNCQKHHDPKSKLCQIIGPHAHGCPESLQRPAGWPMLSTGMAVKPRQVKEAQALDRKRGAPPTEYVPDRHGYTAKPKFVSEQHKRAYIKAHGYKDNNSFYGG